MSTFRSVVWSSVGKKFLTGITGLMLFGFICVHLLGNLMLLKGPEAFNGYAHFLEHLLHGLVVIVFEAGLVVLFLVHMVAAVSVALLDKERARPVKYKVLRNAGGKSRKTLSSRSMIVTGILIIVFVIGHVQMFKFTQTGTWTAPDGTEMKDLYSVVVTAFKSPVIAFGYVAVMILLGLHLRHGFWSAFQSLGWNSDKWMPLLGGAALVFAVLLAVGFLILPLIIHFNSAIVPITT